MHRLYVSLVVLGATSFAWGQELLLNPSFTQPAIPEACQEDWQDIEAWQIERQKSPPELVDRRNGDFLPGMTTLPPELCGDGARASLQGWGSETMRLYQTVNVTPGTSYQLTGEWWFGHLQFFAFAKLTVSAELRDGTDHVNGALIAKVDRDFRANGNTGGWLPFAVCGTAASGQMTVVLKAVNTDIVGYALHVDNTSLVSVTSCPAQANDINYISPAYGAKGASLSNVVVSGSGFVAGQNSVKLVRSSHPDIVATGVSVTNSDNLTCTLNLAGAAPGRYNVVVTFTNGSPAQAILPAGFLVVLPGFTNPGFELPTAAGACPATPIFGIPTDWQVSAINTWDEGGDPANNLYRDGTTYTPTCPSPEGLHYASTFAVPANPDAQPEVHIYQTVKVDNTKTYTVSGQFAGGGPNTTTLELLDGDETSDIGSSAAVHDGNTGPYDWTWSYAQLKPAADLLTIRWRVSTRSGGTQAAHADALVMEVCDAATAVAVTAINPAQAPADSPLSGATITGVNFKLPPAAAPHVLLEREGKVAINATQVVVNSATSLSADFPVMGAQSGAYELVVVQDGCVSRLPDALTIVAGAFVNGSFELTTTQDPIDCQAPDHMVSGIPAGWSAVLAISNAQAPGFDRDHNVHAPAVCPSPDGGHYGSLTFDRAGEAIAYQTIHVQPGLEMIFSGQFAGGGANDVFIELREGDISGATLNSTQLHASASPDPYGWTVAEVRAKPVGDTLTVVWRMVTSGWSLHASHADGLTVLPVTSICHSPFADTDDDDDVDQIDFAMFQICYTGFDQQSIPSAPEYCLCFDRDNSGAGDGDIDALDLSRFIDCVSGPTIASNINCGE